MRDIDGIVLNHLDAMTDSTGLIQHAIYSIPRRDSGYTTDDNARALRLCTRLWRLNPTDRMLQRVGRFLSFVEYARCPLRGFHNFMAYDRNWLDTEGSEDCQGQVIRALAEVLGSGLPDDHRDLARELIDRALPTLADLRSLRAQAYLILGWGHLWTEDARGIDLLEGIARSAAKRLVVQYRRCADADWPWFEPQMSYANAVLPHALFMAARRWPEDDFLQVAETSFAFLDQVTTADSIYCPIGNNGWYSQGGDKALYDQQPIEAATTADAALTAFESLNDQKYLATFGRAHDWFHGQNNLETPLIDVERGACCDGLNPFGVNRNQGAESTLAYLSTELLNFEVRSSLFESHGIAVGSI